MSHTSVYPTLLPARPGSITCPSSALGPPKLPTWDKGRVPVVNALMWAQDPASSKPTGVWLRPFARAISSSFHLAHSSSSLKSPPNVASCRGLPLQAPFAIRSPLLFPHLPPQKLSQLITMWLFGVTAFSLPDWKLLTRLKTYQGGLIYFLLSVVPDI